MISVIMENSMLPMPFDQMPDQALVHIELRKGENLFRQGDHTTGIFYLRSGAVTLNRYSSAGDRLVVHNVMQGETFAEASLFSSQYHCDADTVSASKITKIDSEQVLKKFSSDAVFANALAGRFASQIQEGRRRVELISVRDAAERVFQAICDGLLTGNIKIFAEQIGLTHETTYRALAKLVTQKRLEKTARGAYQRN